VPALRAAGAGPIAESGGWPRGPALARTRLAAAHAATRSDGVEGGNLTGTGGRGHTDLDGAPGGGGSWPEAAACPRRSLGASAVAYPQKAFFPA